jgi:hypothetical protein
MYSRDGRFCERTAQRHRRSLTPQVCLKPPVSLNFIEVVVPQEQSKYIRTPPL